MSHLQDLQQCIIDGNCVRLPDYQFPAKSFTKVKRLIEGIGGNWSTQTQAFEFTQAPDELFQRICDGETINLERDFKKRYQFFPTPKAVLRLIEDRIHIGRDMRVLEPSAGQGAICKHLRSLFPNHDWQLDVCEINSDFHPVLEGMDCNIVGTDFLQMSAPRRGYHLIVANPPFSGGQDVIHFMRMYDLLAPGGRLLCVMSQNIASSKQSEYADVREWLGYYFHELIEIPKGSFRSSGTNVKTYLVQIDKPFDETYVAPSSAQIELI